MNAALHVANQSISVNDGHHQLTLPASAARSGCGLSDEVVHSQSVISCLTCGQVVHTCACLCHQTVLFYTD